MYKKLTSVFYMASIINSVALVILLCLGVGAAPPSIREIGVAPTDKSVTFPITWPDRHQNRLLILVKLPATEGAEATEVAQVTPQCSVTGANSYRERVQGSLTSKRCNVVLSNPVKEDEGFYETRLSSVKGTRTPDPRIKLIFGDHSRSEGSKNANTSNMLIFGAIILAVYMLSILPL